MAEPRRQRNKQSKVALNKEEMKVMKHLRFNVKTDDGKMQSSTVPYFYGKEIVDCLISSKYASVPPSGSTKPYFPDRKSAVIFLTRALQTGVFVRVERKRRRVDRDAEPERGSKQLRKRVTASGKTEKADGGASASGKESEAEKDKKEAKKKPKRAVKLTYHADQVFVDSEESMYTWHYDPTRPRNVVLGFLLVFGVIAACLYPIWPRDVQIYTSYLSRIALVVLGILLVILLLRYVIAAVVYVMTFGRVKFWILPNVDDDKLGFWDSFKPIYSITLSEPSKRKKKVTSSREAEKLKEKSDIEQPDDAKTKDEAGEKKRSAKKRAARDTEPNNALMLASSVQHVESKSSTDGDEDHQFEMINKDEL